MSELKDYAEKLARGESEFKKQFRNPFRSPFGGVDFSTSPDRTVIAAPCGNCETYRVITNGIMEKCPFCGDDETDLNEDIQIP